MQKAILAIACLLFTAQTAPPEPSEIIKRRALLMGYWLNGDSMVRPPSMGSIDVSEIVTIPDRPPESTIPPQLPSTLGTHQGEKVRPVAK